jgi:hypothetical protein
VLTGVAAGSNGGQARGAVEGGDGAPIAVAGGQDAVPCALILRVGHHLRIGITANNPLFVSLIRCQTCHPEA